MERAAGFDVAIVGGSIAGCTTAILLARQGATVTLIEAHSDPNSYKALCTHFIQPCATPTIERLGIDGLIESSGGLRNSVDIWNRWGWIRRPESGEPAPYGYNIKRERLDPMLRQAAAGTPGVELMMGRTATGLVKENGRITGVEVRDAGGNVETIAARLVVGADGRHSKTAELAGVGARSMPNNRSGYFAYFERIDIPNDTTKFWFLDPEIAYAFPNGDGSTILALMFDRARNLEWFRKDLAGNLIRVIERLPDAPDLSKAVRVSKMIGEVDLPNKWRNRPPGGLAFAGDAIVAGDPLFGIGCGWAFQTGEWLAEAVAAHLDNPAELDQAAAGYRSRVRKHILAHYLMTSEYSRSRKYLPAEKILFSAGARDARIAELIQGFGARTLPAHKLVSPVTMARAVAVNLRSRPDKDQVLANRTKATLAVTPPIDRAGNRSGEVKVAGIVSPYIEAGDNASEEAVVFVHGNPGSSEDFTDLVASAGRLGRAVAVDMPGFGRAGKPAGFDYTVEGYASHLGKVLEALKIERAHLVLHDFGGPWGLAWAAAHPESCGSLTLIDTGVLLDYKWHYLARIWQTPVVGEMFNASASRPAFQLLLRHGNPSGGLPKDFVNRMFDEYDAGTKRAILRLYRATRHPKEAFRTLAAALKNLDVPVLVIWGKKDPYVGVEQAEAQRATFLNAKVKVLEGSGHWPFIDNPEAVSAELMPFLEQALFTGERVGSA